MWAADTNLLVRYYTRDDEKQAGRALAWLQDHAPCFVAISVVQELYWVLESSYDLAPRKVLEVLQHLCDSPAFQLESSASVQQALRVALQGIEFPDALHGSLSAACQGLATFDDRGFARKAKKLELKPGVVVP